MNPYPVQVQLKSLAVLFIFLSEVSGSGEVAKFVSDVNTCVGCDLFLSNFSYSQPKFDLTNSPVKCVGILQSHIFPRPYSSKPGHCFDPSLKKLMHGMNSLDPDKIPEQYWFRAELSFLPNHVLPPIPVCFPCWRMEVYGRFQRQLDSLLLG